MCLNTPLPSSKEFRNSSSPIPGIWACIHLNNDNSAPLHTSIFKFCNFNYANTGIFITNFSDTLIVRNSNFKLNINGLFNTWGGIVENDNSNFKYNLNYGMGGIYNSITNHCNISDNKIGIQGYYSTLYNCIIDSNQTGVSISFHFTIDSCTVSHNQTGINGNNEYCCSAILNSCIDSNTSVGISFVEGDFTNINNNKIISNGIGISDSIASNHGVVTGNDIENNLIGIKLGSVNNNLYCNKICNNVIYDLEYTSTSNVNISNNYWCTLDSASIQSLIFDGNDSSGIGLVTYMPFDTVNCYYCSNLILTESATLASHLTHNGTGTVYPHNGKPPYSYSWNTSPVQTTQTAIGLGTGTYTACVIDSLGCTACINVYVGDSATVNVNENFSNFSFWVFPNPVTNMLTIESPLNAVIKITSIQGQTILQQQLQQGKTVIDISGFAKGVYILRVCSNDKTEVTRIVKE